MTGAPAKGKTLRRWIPAFLGAVVGGFLFFLYLRTLAPTVMPYDQPLHFDTAMLQVQAATLSIAHPTGYPAYMLFTHPFTYLPLGEVAYRVNLASAVYGTAAAVMVYVAGWQLTRRAAAAAAGALAFGVGATFWSQAAVASVYTLNALFIMLTICAWLLWRDSGRDRYLLAAAFLTGLSMTNHMTSGILIPVGALFVAVVAPRRLLEPGTILKSAGAFLLGLSLYVYLPVRALMDAPLNEADPSSPSRFLDVITGGGMQDNSFVFPGGIIERLGLYSDYLLQNFHPALVVLGLAGAIYLLLTDPRAAVLIGSFFSLYLTFALGYDIPDIFQYFIPTYLMFALFISAALGGLLELASDLSGRLAPASGRSMVAALSVAMLALPLIGVGETYRQENLSDDYRGRGTIEAVAEHTEPGSTVLHYRSPLWYMVLVEERRQDLTLVASFNAPWTRYQDIVWPEPKEPELTARYREDTTGVWAVREGLKEGRVYVLAQESANPEALRNAGYRFEEVGGDTGLFEVHEAR